MRAGINGYGNVGKKCADAVGAQDDKALVGVSDIVGDYRVKIETRFEKAKTQDKAGTEQEGMAK